MQLLIKSTNNQQMPINATHIHIDKSRLIAVLDNDLVVFADFLSVEECKSQYEKMLKCKFRTPSILCEKFGFLMIA